MGFILFFVADRTTLVTYNGFCWLAKILLAWWILQSVMHLHKTAVATLHFQLSAHSDSQISEPMQTLQSKEYIKNQICDNNELKYLQSPSDVSEKINDGLKFLTIALSNNNWTSLRYCVVCIIRSHITSTYRYITCGMR